VRREVCVERGYENRTGRLDLEICQGDQQLAIVEVKTQSFNDSDLDKHEGYRACVRSTETDLIFLSVGSPDSDLGNFRFLPWADVCVALRRIAPALLGAEHILSTALVLAFVGAVEQNLLGFSSQKGLTGMEKTAQMVEHFLKAAVVEEIRGRFYTSFD
jgi:hypothetical protein